VNVVSVIGRLVKDPELKVTAGGTSICNMRVAVDGAGQKQDDGKYASGFFDVTAFGTLADSCGQYLAKGRQIGVAGRLSFQEWEKDGQKRNKVEISAMQVDFLGGKTDSEGSGNFAQPAATAPAASAADDDIPF